jgi:isocitrate lyase
MPVIYPSVLLTFNVPQWSGADYADNLIKTVTGGVSSTAAMGKGVTEAQFATKSKM